jgi:hypothetical protein
MMWNLFALATARSAVTLWLGAMKSGPQTGMGLGSRGGVSAIPKPDGKSKALAMASKEEPSNLRNADLSSLGGMSEPGKRDEPVKDRQQSRGSQSLLCGNVCSA